MIDKKLKRIHIFIIFISIVFLVIFIFVYWIQDGNTAKEVSLRKFPYPYRAALSICSDIDGTNSIEEFLEIQQYLCSHQMTSMGRGLGLEIGNSFFMYSHSPHSFSYFVVQEDGSIKISKSAPVIRKFMKAGLIDVIHSWGQYPLLAKNQLIPLAVKELTKYDCKIDIWVNHSHRSNPQNLGDYENCFGDNIETDYYHANLTLEYGIKFVWVGSVTPIVGQEVAFEISMLFDFFKASPFKNSLINYTKFNIKFLLGLLGKNEYTMDTTNKLIRMIILDDGRKIYEFKRFNNNPMGVWENADLHGLAYQISSQNLNTLKMRQGYMIIYTHLGKNSSGKQRIASKTKKALINLANEFWTGKIWVTTTSKLLNYNIVHTNLEWDYELRHNLIKINIQQVNDAISGSYVPTINDLAGITFYIPPQIDSAEVCINGIVIDDIKINDYDFNGKKSVMIPVKPLQYPSINLR